MGRHQSILKAARVSILAVWMGLSMGFISTAFGKSVIVDATDPDTLQRLMQENGYVVSQDIDKYGDPRFESRISRTTTRVLFYGCKNGQNCKYIMFSAGWNLDDGIAGDVINEWNREKVWGKAHLDEENDPFLELVVNMDGGVTAENFLDTVDWWRITLEKFEKHINW